jgi:hypothetical protein
LAGFQGAEPLGGVQGRSPWPSFAHPIALARKAAPLFGFALGYILLGERLSPRQMLGGAVIVAATVLLTLGGGARGGRFKLRLAVLMLGSALMVALSTAIFKLFAIRDEFWTTTAWTGVGQALFGLALLARASTWRAFRTMLHGDAAGGGQVRRTTATPDAASRIPTAAPGGSGVTTSGAMTNSSLLNPSAAIQYSIWLPR